MTAVVLKLYEISNKYWWGICTFLFDVMLHQEAGTAAGHWPALQKAWDWEGQTSGGVEQSGKEYCTCRIIPISPTSSLNWWLILSHWFSLLYWLLINFSQQLESAIELVDFF